MGSSILPLPSWVDRIPGRTLVPMRVLQGFRVLLAAIVAVVELEKEAEWASRIG